MLKVPATVLQEELSPPHTPHLSLRAFEFSTWSQPACCPGGTERRDKLNIQTTMRAGAEVERVTLTIRTGFKMWGAFVLI